MDEQKQRDANEGTMGPSRSTVGLEMHHPPEMMAAFEKIAAAAEKSAVAPRREVIPDDSVWLGIFCAVAGCFNSERSAALKWADEGLTEFKKRFPR